MQGGKAREVTVDEALQHKTYQQAIAGNRMASREVLKMIAKREKALAAKRVPNRQTHNYELSGLTPRMPTMLFAFSALPAQSYAGMNDEDTEEDNMWSPCCSSFGPCKWPSTGAGSGHSPRKMSPASKLVRAIPVRCLA